MTGHKLLRLRAQEALRRTSYSVNAKLTKNIEQKWNVCLKDAHERTWRRGRANLSVDTTAVQLCIGDNIKDEVVPRNNSFKIIVPFDNKLSSAHDNIPVLKKRDGMYAPLTTDFLKTARTTMLTVTNSIGYLQSHLNQREKYWKNT